MAEGILEEIRRLSPDSHRIMVVGILNAVGRARNVTGQKALRSFGEPVIVVGTDFTLLHQLYSAWRLRDGVVVQAQSGAVIGERVAERLLLERGLPQLNTN